MKLIVVLVFAFAQLASAASTFYVATNGAGTGTTWADATNNLQGAIDEIATGATNTVWVSNGVYQTGGVTNWPLGTLLTNRVAITKVITVRSLNGPAVTTIMGVWNSTTTNGPDAVRCVYMSGSSRLLGFTVTNGATWQVNYPTVGTNDNHRGGGVLCASLTPIISNCVITGNSAGNNGGGVYSGTVYNCTVSGNYAYEGGGARDSTLYNCIVTGNRAIGSGGGRGCVWYNCLISDNTGNPGGVGYGTLYNCTVVSNSGPSYGGVFAASWLVNCIVYFNSIASGTESNWSTMATSGRWVNVCTAPSNTAAYMWPVGCITDNPMLVGKDAGNYRLRMRSPCVSAGSTNGYSWMFDAKDVRSKDLDGNPRIRPTDGMVDMGAYETILWHGTIYGFH